MQVISKYVPNRGTVRNERCNESHVLQVGMSVLQVVRCVYLASNDVKSEGSILLKETMIHSYCVVKEVCGALHVVWEKFY